MAGTITLAMRTAQSGLLASQGALSAVANNISNANTVGYSRKIVQLEQRVVSGTGAGVQLSDVTRAIDDGLLKSLRTEASTLGTYSVTQSYYARIQELFGSPADNTSISHITEKFTEALETLSLSPDRTSEQSDAIRWAAETAIELQTMSATIQDLRLQADVAIADSVTEINLLSAEIEDLNNKIIRNETISNDVTDLKDKRDIALDKLSDMLDISYVSRTQGDVVVFTAGGHILVDNTAQTVTHVQASNIQPNNTYEEGHFNGIFVGGTATTDDMTGDLSAGELAGLINMRDKILPGIQAQIDEFASELKAEINKVHNRGTPFPGYQEVTGSRQFVDSATQQITLASSADVKVVIFDATGNQVATESLTTIMGSASYGANNGASDWDIDDIATDLQAWLRQTPTSALTGGNLTTATVSLNSDRKFAIDLNSSSYYIAFRDETSTTAGSTHQDTTIQFDEDGSGTNDKNISGFSNFLGLNDFFIDGLKPTIHDSAVKLSAYTWEPGADVAVTMEYYNTTTSAVVSATSTFTAAAAPYTLAEIAAKINTDISWVTATVVQDGSGYRLRVTHDDSEPFIMADDQGIGGTHSFMDALGMEVSSVRTSTFLDVRADIKETPGLMAHGAPQWDADLGSAGQYYTSEGDSSISQAMAAAMTSNHSFQTSGGLNATTTDFATYAASVLSHAATESDKNDSRYETQKSLKESLELKSNNIRGVNLDEEMSNLLLYQQSYSAAARLITTIKAMFDALDRAVS